MKTRLIKNILVMLMAFFAVPIFAQDALVVFFNDGNFRKFYLRDIIEISTSQYDEDGVAHSDYQYQHITTTSNKFVYDLSNINSIGFSKYNEIKAEQNFIEAMPEVANALSDCETISDAEEQIAQIKAKKGVEDAWSDSHQLYVKIEEGETFAFHFDHGAEADDNWMESDGYQNFAKAMVAKAKEAENSVNGKLRAVIANQQYKDEKESRVNDRQNYQEPLLQAFWDCGIEADYVKNPKVDFFYDNSSNPDELHFYDYDIILLITHGAYLEPKYLAQKGSFWRDFHDEVENYNLKCHAIATGEEITNIAVKGSYNDKWKEQYSKFKEWRDNSKYKNVSDIDIYFEFIKEKRGGEWRWIGYPMLTEHFFRHIATGRFKDNSIMFNTACQSLLSDDGPTQPSYSFVNELFDKNLSIYLGYTESDFFGAGIMPQFLHNMLKRGHSIGEVYNTLPEHFRIESKYNLENSNYPKKQNVYEDGGPCDAELRILPEESDEAKQRFLFKVYTNEMNPTDVTQEYYTNNTVTISCTLTATMPTEIKTGFKFGTDKNNLSTDIGAEFNREIENQGKGNCHFLATLTNLEPGKTYYYRAYTFDGMNYNYGDPCSFTINGGNTPDDRMKVGDSFTVPTKEGTEVVYTITKKDASGNTCKVGFNAIAASSGVKRLAGSNISPAIDLETVGTITIPELAAGYKVTALGKNAFKGCKKLTAVNLPKSILEIGQSAAEGCSGLTSISIPKNVEIIKANAYGGCGNVTGVYCEISDPFAIDINVFLTEDEESRGVTNSSIFTKATLYVPVGSKGKYASMEGWKKFKYIEENTDEENNAPEGVVAIDLGLPSGTKWASCNLGASKPEDDGDYYNWGETEENIFNLYGSYVKNYSDISGTEYDIAHVKLGGSWCMPTDEDFTELLSNCTSEWTMLNGVTGKIFTSKINGNSIFLPATGVLASGTFFKRDSEGSYLTSTLRRSYNHYSVFLFDSAGDTPTCLGVGARCIRPVIPNITDLTLITTEPITFKVGEKATVIITSGNDSYMVESNNESVATARVIDISNVIIKGISVGTAKITVTDNRSGETATIAVNVTSDVAPDVFLGEAIDLGLPSGTMWASCNVGAKRPEEYGDYYAWGETKEKDTYTWENYIHSDGSKETCHDLGEDISGTEYDVAHVKCGGKWVMPTHDEQMELLYNCTSEFTTLNGVRGCKFIGPNGNSIFLPAAGEYLKGDIELSKHFGYYWTSTLWRDSTAHSTQITKSYWMDVGSHRKCGLSVRPVIPTSLMLSNSAPITVKVGNKTPIEITSGNGSYTAESDNESVAIAYIYDNVTVVVKGMSVGTATITVTDNRSGEKATVTVTVTDGDFDQIINGYEAIDLGLPSGTMWASCNVGATKPEEYGGYYAWGETSEKFNYDWSTYVHADGYWESIHDIGSDISGTEYDVAHVKWGGDWCMPTHDEQRELVNNCTSEWTMLNGVNGWKFTSRINGNSIFLPNAGFRRGRDSYDGGCYYRSSSCISTSQPPFLLQEFYVWSLYFDSSDVGWSPIKTQEEGYSVRPVIHSTPTLVDLTLSITDPITVLVNDKVPVQITTGNGSYTAESDNKDVAIASVDDYATIIINCVSAGTATITVTDTKSGQTAIITIVVNDRFIDPDNLLPDYFAQAGEGTIPEGWFVMFDREERPSQTSYGSGPRMFEFAFGGDFTKGLYFRQGYVEYGSTEGYPLTLESGKGYLISFTTAMWKENGTNTRFEIINSAGEVVFVQVVENSPNVNGRTAAVYDASKHSFLFRPDVSGNYVIRWSATKTEIGEPDYLNKEYMEIILANPQVKYVPTE